MKTIALLFLILSPIPNFAQRNSYPAYLGINTGLNIARLSHKKFDFLYLPYDDPNIHINQRESPFISFFLEIPGFRNRSGLIELGYFFNGSTTLDTSYRVGYINHRTYQEIKFNYIHLPLYTKQYFSRYRSGLFINYGFGFSFFQSGRIWREELLDTGNPGGISIREQQLPASHIIQNRFDIYLLLGLGWQQDLWEGKLQVEFRYMLGLLDISNRAEYAILNRNSLFTLGYKLPLENLGEIFRKED
ncbi:MAG: outer membrane beta-barrel protein [Bacteroidia bacterium]|nr:outer membrane beta-barrel protein [Bacteroidia bacterium]